MSYRHYANAVTLVPTLALFLSINYPFNHAIVQNLISTVDLYTPAGHRTIEQLVESSG